MLIQDSKGQESFGRAIHCGEVTTNLEWAFYFSSQITALESKGFGDRTRVRAHLHYFLVEWLGKLIEFFQLQFSHL